MQSRPGASDDDDVDAPLVGDLLEDRRGVSVRGHEVPAHVTPGELPFGLESNLLYRRLFVRSYRAGGTKSEHGHGGAGRPDDVDDRQLHAVAPGRSRTERQRIATRVRPVEPDDQPRDAIRTDLEHRG